LIFFIVSNHVQIKSAIKKDILIGILIDWNSVITYIRNYVTLTRIIMTLISYILQVYQGNVRGLDGSNVTPVAIKMLQKDATLQEKAEFLQEAKVMSHFQHKHVLRLLGVCLDTDPLLVLEFMEVGDLLSYLRRKRTLQPTDEQALRLQDLLSICEDVARGCRYLEKLHFVHRDIACRNCLVSGGGRENRVVKIGDFGLARDISLCDRILRSLRISHSHTKSSFLSTLSQSNVDLVRANKKG